MDFGRERRIRGDERRGKGAEQERGGVVPCERLERLRTSLKFRKKEASMGDASLGKIGVLRGVVLYEYSIKCYEPRKE